MVKSKSKSKTQRRRKRNLNQNVWKDKAIVSIDQGETKYFNTTDFEKPNDHPWKILSTKLEITCKQAGALIQLDILDPSGLTIATAGPKTIGNTPKTMYVRNPDKYYIGAGKQQAYNLVQIKNLCTEKQIQNAKCTGMLTVTCSLKSEIFKPNCPIYLRESQEMGKVQGTSKDEIDGMSTSFEEKIKQSETKIQHSTSDKSTQTELTSNTSISENMRSLHLETDESDISSSYELIKDKRKQIRYHRMEVSKNRQNSQKSEKQLPHTTIKYKSD